MQQSCVDFLKLVHETHNITLSKLSVSAKAMENAEDIMNQLVRCSTAVTFCALENNMEKLQQYALVCYYISNQLHCILNMDFENDIVPLMEALKMSFTSKKNFYEKVVHVVCALNGNMYIESIEQSIEIICCTNKIPNGIKKQALTVYKKHFFVQNDYEFFNKEMAVACLLITKLMQNKKYEDIKNKLSPLVGQKCLEYVIMKSKASKTNIVINHDSYQTYTESIQNHWSEPTIIGSGTFGTAYSAVLKKVKVAVKHVKINPSEDTTCNWLREIATSRKLCHVDHIAWCRNLFICKSNVFLECWMELPLATCSLDAFFRKGNDTREKFPKLYQMVGHHLFKALSCMHDMNLIHRDVKPSNVLLFCNNEKNVNEPTEIKLTDFGSARYFDEDNECNTTDFAMTGKVFSLWWEPPEAILEKNYNAKADVWSAFVVVVETILGNYLFNSIAECQSKDVLEQMIFFLEWDTGLLLFTNDLKNAEMMGWMKQKRHLVQQKLRCIELTENFENALLTKGLCFDPQTRMSSFEALAYFT